MAENWSIIPQPWELESHPGLRISNIPSSELTAYTATLARHRGNQVFVK